MTRSFELTSIDCTACGAGLDILGGGRVVVHICPYCGTELDALDGYRALRKFTDLKRPDSPFAIGMKAHLFDVDFTVVGTIAQQETWAGRSWNWVEHQLFSPTHGYAWLTVEDGHVTFARRFRQPVWMSVRQVETAETPPTVWASARLYKYYETCESKITFAEGEFTWAPRIGETTTTVSALSDDAMLDFSETGSEQEIYRSVYLVPAVVEAAFGQVTGLRPKGVHPLQAYHPGREAGFLKRAGLALAAICLVLGIVLSFLPGQPALPVTRLQISQLPVELPFEVAVPDRLVKIDIDGDVLNSWAFVEIEVFDPEDVPLFGAGRTVEFYTGRDADGSWTEGSSRSTLRFNAPVAGTYTLALEVSEAEHWIDPSNRARASRQNAPISALTVSATSGLSSGLWLLLLGVGFATLSALPILRRWRHTRARWSGTDWTDED
jgi:hypothetical protein